MNIAVSVTSRLKATIDLPASKSYSIRAAIIAACGGRSVLRRFSRCDDALRALYAASQLGASVNQSAYGDWEIHSRGISPRGKKLDVGESGTVLRFVLPLLAFRDKRIRVTGRGTLKGRPNHHLTRVLRAKGADVRGCGVKDSIPIDIRPGSLKKGMIRIDGSLSSQFISALLIACPALPFPTTVCVTGRNPVSRTYIEMTLRVLKKSGIRITKKRSGEFRITGNQRFKGLGNFLIPADYGLAAFLLGAGVLIPSDLTLKGHLSTGLIQADGAILSLLKKMGVRLQASQRQIRIKGPQQIRGGAYSLRDSPDLVPVLTVLALFARGHTRIYGIGHVRAKESDRISDLRRELIKIGAKIKEKRDELIVEPQPAYRRNVLLDPHRDHRLAMAFSILGLKIGARIKGIECTHKSYPAFLDDLKRAGAKVRTIRR